MKIKLYNTISDARKLEKTLTNEKEIQGVFKKAELEQKWSDNSYIQDLMEIKERISNRNFD